MSQAQPRRPARPEPRRRRRPEEAVVTDLEQRRRRRQPSSQPQGQPSARRTSSKRRGPLVPFVLGIAVGVGLAGPLPSLTAKALAGLLPHGHAIGSLIPFGIGGRRILVLGSDKVSASTDVMFTVQIKDGKTQLTQLPRDTFIESQRFGILKANALYAFGGLNAIRQDLPPVLGGPVDRYFKVNLRAVQRVADALGGVEVDVPKRMYYVDNSQGLYIDLYPGKQLLKGAGDDVKTDLSPVELGQLVTAMAGTKLSTAQIPGRLFWHNDLSYWMPNSNTHYPTGSGLSASESGGV